MKCITCGKEKPEPKDYVLRVIGRCQDCQDKIVNARKKQGGYLLDGSVSD